MHLQGIAVEDRQVLHSAISMRPAKMQPWNGETACPASVPLYIKSIMCLRQQGVPKTSKLHLTRKGYV